MKEWTNISNINLLVDVWNLDQLTRDEVKSEVDTI